MNDNFRSFTNNQQMIAHMRKLAKESKTTTEVILEEYTLDDFVQRIAKSKYRNNLILKGGFLLSSLMGINNRTTEDIDTDIKGKDLSLPEVTKMVDEIFEKLDDNQFLWQFTFSEIESNSAMKKKWENYTHEKAYAENIEFQDTLLAIKELMTELFSENLTVKS